MGVESRRIEEVSAGRELGNHLRVDSRLLAGALVALLLLVYLPSLFGGFLNYDDPWLIENNALLVDGSLGALGKILGDFSFETRMILGAEYLPVRDLSHWLEVRVFGIWPQGMRIVQLVLFIGAVLIFRATLRRCFGFTGFAEIAAWAFALHPLHVESVAWLAGRKDVLAMLFIALALWTYSGKSRWRWLSVPFFVALASLSKSMAVASLSLLPVIDLMLKRRVEFRVLSITALVVLGLLLLHFSIGQSVSMSTSPLGGSRTSAFISMGLVIWHYLWTMLFLPGLSVVYDVSVLQHWTWASAFGWLLLLFWGSSGLWLWRARQQPMLLIAWCWCWLPLAPVSQVLVPLENVMADRYLYLSVMAPALAVASFANSRLMASRGIAWLLLAIFALFTALRAHTFAQSERLFVDALSKTENSGIPPYQLAMLAEENGDLLRAQLYYEQVFERDSSASEPARRATNNLSRLLAAKNRNAEAEEILRRGAHLWPHDEKVMGNFAEVLSRRGKIEEAQRVCRAVTQQFPESNGARRCRSRYPGNE